MRKSILPRVKNRNKKNRKASRLELREIQDELGIEGTPLSALHPEGRKLLDLRGEFSRTAAKSPEKIIQNPERRKVILGEKE